MKFFTQIPVSVTKTASKHMGFPPEELPQLRSRLSAGKTIGTTRVDVEKGKYREGDIVLSELGPLRVLSVTEGQGVENHPHYGELTDEWKAQIGGQPWDYVELAPAEFNLSGLPERFKVYRSIWLADDEQPRLDDPGSFWADSPEGASRSGFPPPPGKRRQVILEAEVSRDDVDPKQTISRRRRYGEPEVVLKADPKQVRLYSEDQRKKTDIEKMQEVDMDVLDFLAFGVIGDEIVEVSPKSLHVAYKDDYDDATHAFLTGGMGWAKEVSLEEPIDVQVREGGDMYVVDGYHRWIAADKTGRNLKARIEIKAKPIDELVKKGYDWERLKREIPEAARKVKEIKR
jgi:hypothetical protein